MGYSRDVYLAAEDEMQRRRMDALREADERSARFYEKYPRALELERLLLQTGVKAGKAVVGGADVKEELLKLKEANQAQQKELRGIFERAGVPEDYLQPHFYCKNCEDRGYVDGKRCPCMENLLREKAFNKLNRLSPLSLSSFETFSLEDYSDERSDGGPSSRRRMTQIFNYCKKYAKEFTLQSDSLVFCGATGLGKTHLALAIANEVTNMGFGVVYCSAPDVVQALEKEQFSRSADDKEDGVRKALLDCDLLILDDLGTEFITQFTSGAVYNVFNSRLTAGKPTIISTNLSLKEMEKYYSERFVSRISGSCQRLDFIGNDVRVLIKKERLGKKAQ